MTAAIDAKHLRQVGLTPFEIRTLNLLMQTGGEYAVPSHPLAQACIDNMIGKGLVELVQRGARQMVRMTDQGRAVATQLEAMNAAPKIEVVQA